MEDGRWKVEGGSEFRSVLGGVLAQTPDTRRADELEIRVVTKRGPSADEMEDLRFAWGSSSTSSLTPSCVARPRYCRHRLWTAEPPLGTGVRLEHAEECSGRARSDAFFPFAREDAVEAACKAGITAIIQPGGGARDEEAIEVCDEYDVAMVFSGTRAFRH
jgi:phosphoribosylaminoimidazolecarboxamide formyltransferase/IMP cyclohydrolase